MAGSTDDKGRRTGAKVAEMAPSGVSTPKSGIRTEAFTFLFLFVFFTITDIVYWIFSHEPAGTVALALTAGLGLLIGFYLYVSGNRVGPRPEDRPMADIAEGAGVMGHFSPQSLWAPLVAASMAVALLGFIFGLWITVIGAILGVAAVGGMVFEHYLGLPARHAQNVPN